MMISFKCPYCPAVHYNHVWGEKIHCTCGRIIKIGYPESIKVTGFYDPEFVEQRGTRCQRCGSDRVATVSARCKDMCWVKFKDETDEGYPPDWVGSGDNVKFELCLTCGQVQGEFPRWTDWELEDEDE
jgi:hypothetical protein